MKFLSVYVTIPVEFLCYWKHDSLVEVYFHKISQETPIQVSCEVSLRLYNYDFHWKFCAMYISASI